MRAYGVACIAGGVIAAVLVLPASAGATIVELQAGTYVSASAGSITPTLPSASIAGSTLVAVVSNGFTSSQKTFTAPTGWTSAVQTYNGCCGEVEIWYYVNNPGGISSATFTAGSGTKYIAGEMSEWNGVVSSAPLDQTGSRSHLSATSDTISTASSLTSAGELGITGFSASKGGLGSFTAGTGWAHLFSDPTTNGDVGDWKTGLASGAAASDTETETGIGGPMAPSWLAAIATFKAATCSGGSLTVGTPTSVSFPAVTMNGTNQTVSTTLALTPNDLSGSGAGWNITGTSTTFTNASSRTLSTSATQVTGVSTTTSGGNCVLPTNAVTYPLTLPAGATAPTAVKLYNAAAGTGKGPQTVTLTEQLAVPANAYNGTYSSTWTIAIVSGP